MKIKLERRLVVPPMFPIFIVFLSLLLSFIVLGIVFYGIKKPPIEAFKIMFYSTIGDSDGRIESIVLAIPLILCGLAAAIALKIKFWNIGGEGQLYMGAFGATWAAGTFSNLPSYLLLPILLLSGMIAGAFWASIAAYLKLKLNINEIITTIFLNYIAMSWVYFLIFGPWRDPVRAGFQISFSYVIAARLPQFFDSRIHFGLIFAVISAVILYIIMNKTAWGYELKAVGACPGAAECAGINIENKIISVAIISGALAGLGGMSEISGLRYQLQPHNISQNFGFLGILIAFLSNFNPLVVIGMGTFMGIILASSKMLQIALQIPDAMTVAFAGVVMFFLAVGGFFRIYRIRIIS